METQCGHIRLNIQCVPPDDYRAARVPEEEICVRCQAEFHLRAQQFWTATSRRPRTRPTPSQDETENRTPSEKP